MKHLRLEIQPGGWLLLAVLYFFCDLEGFLVILCSAAVHEWGHLAVLRRMGVPVRRIQLDLTGLCIFCYDGLLNRRKCFAVAAAGPLAGLVAALPASMLGILLEQETLLLFAGAGAVLSGFNLLPAKPLDGWRMLQALCPRLAPVISGAAALLVLVAGLGVMYAGYGTAPAFMGIVLLLQNGQSYCKI